MEQPIHNPPPCDSPLEAETTANPAFSQLVGIPSLIVDTRAALNIAPSLKKGEDNVFYLAYGSNLCASTFLGRRQIRPISSTNVVVPSLTLTFGLPGIAYLEPCFANVRSSEEDAGNREEDADADGWWRGGLIGVVYEVTPADYAKIFATEGGGTGYQLIKVAAKPLDGGPTIQARTLCAPPSMERHHCGGGRHAQPSLRYLNLLRTGAHEHGLPESYQAWLTRLQEYRRTTWRQRVGAAIWGMAWMPLVVIVVMLGSVLADGDGRSPARLRACQKAVMGVQWGIYDGGFGRVFGDGERTVGGDGERVRLLNNRNRG